MLAPHEPPDADVLAVVALAVYVLPDGSTVDTVEQLLDGELDIEGEPAGLRDRIRAGLHAAGHTGDDDPLLDLLAKLTYRRPFAIADAPLHMTGGLTRDHSRLYAALSRTRALLA